MVAWHLFFSLIRFAYAVFVRDIMNYFQTEMVAVQEFSQELIFIIIFLFTEVSTTDLRHSNLPLKRHYSIHYMILSSV